MKTKMLKTLLYGVIGGETYLLIDKLKIVYMNKYNSISGLNINIPFWFVVLIALIPITSIYFKLKPSSNHEFDSLDISDRIKDLRLYYEKEEV